MLKDLGFLERGKPWPPLCERNRLGTYADNQKLFDGEHGEVFKEIWVRLFRPEIQLSVELVLGWPRRLSVLWADLLLGETPGLADASADKEKTAYLIDLADRLDLWRQSYKAALDMSRFGNTVTKVWRDEEEEVHYSVIPPYHWFPVVNPRDANEIQYHVLAWPSIDDEDEEAGSKVSDQFSRGLYARRTCKLYVEIHSRNAIEFRTYDMSRSGSVLGPWTATEEAQIIAMRKLLVGTASNLETSDSIYGKDDYSDLASILQELEVRFAQLARILDRHADPKMYGPEVETTTDDITGEEVALLGDYIPIADSSGVVPSYLVWNAQTESCFKQISELMQQFYMLSETSPAIFGRLDNGLAESGSALRRLFVAPLAKVSRMRMHLDKAMRSALIVAAKLEDHDVTPVLSWRDGLPDDESETVNTNATAVNGRLSSMFSAIKRTWGLTDEETMAEMLRITSEQRSALTLAQETTTANNSGAAEAPPVDGQSGNTYDGTNAAVKEPEADPVARMMKK